MSVLFDPLSIKGLSLPNRIVMAPMTRTFSPQGVPGDNVAEYYRKRAAGGTGLIVTEGTGIDRPESRNHPGIPAFHGDKSLEGWGHVVEAVHGAGGKIAPQLWHTGLVPAQSPDLSRPGEPEGPSGIDGKGEPFGKAMSEEDVADTVAKFASAAADAVKLGFDTIELHGAHGYLIDQFFWGEMNRRDDKWGGATLPERSRFAAEIVKQVRAAMPADMPLILRVSQWKQQDYTVKLAPTPAEMEAWLGPLVAAGADVIHASQRRFWEPEFPEIDGEKGLNFAGWAKKLTGAATISVGSVALDGEFLAAFAGQSSKVADLGELERRMDAGEFDLIAVGRALIANPEFANKVREGRQSELQGFDAQMLGELV
ncbi:12-oxophytodienoate reductase [Aurantiacibacter xanthus]|uniref:12-oxophytodienoate reductase n=1 Tax=Aurantiacibacter xanthus TaxID=1784712 RepID=A0A3A1P7D9_9SPHN|nr:NADH:flavin oxidoreductase [Aurantiacibacter xanthus]RIV89525.1 12-oxophytodienoate reductase [Aurantiacibacter xanthus]